MNENIKNLIDMMIEEGMSEKEIMRAYWSYKDCKLKNFYKSGKLPVSIKGAMKSVISKPPDSQAEAIFYSILDDADIPFAFQYDIGPYRVDFLIDGHLILEIDGSHHSQRKEYDANRDRYLERMGYEVLRVPIWLIAIDPGAVIDTISETIKEV
jgi:very-short-patch-repair endonuclease